MSLFEKINPSFFTILVSKNKEIYIEFLLYIHECIYRNHTMSIERSLLFDMLEQYMEEKRYRIDFCEEEDFIEIEKELEQEKMQYGKDMHFLLRLFEKHTWINVDLHMDTMKKMVSLPYHTRVFITFVHDLIKEREQIGYLIRIYASLKDIDDEYKIQDSYQHIRNAYADFKELILMLEQTNARIKDYYTIQVKKASTSIYHDFFDVYYEDIVEGYVFPTLVEDSLKRFKHPVSKILEQLINDEKVKEQIIDSAITHYRVSSYEVARKSIEDMLYAMYNDLSIIENLTNHLVESDANFRRLAKQKILYLCNNDQGLRGKLITLLQHMKEEGNDVIDACNAALSIPQTCYMEKDAVYDFSKITKKVEKEVMHFHFDDNKKSQEELEQHMGLDRHFKFSKENIEAYYMEKLNGQKAGKLKDIGIYDQDYYIRSILLYVYGKDRKMHLQTTILPNEKDGITQGKFQFPNLLIMKKE